MTAQVERRQRQLDRYTVAGLSGLSLGSIAGAVREAGLEDWIAAGGGLDRLLLTAWIVGLMVFGIAFFGLSLLGRRLDPTERAALGDEFAVFLNRETTTTAFVLSFVTAVIFSAIPAVSTLSGRAVAMTIVGVGSGALAVGRMRGARQ